jgi:Protein of unknown function (DUF2934)
VLAKKEVAMIERREISKEDIADRAYALYVQRGQESGKDIEDWITAEKELAGEALGWPHEMLAAPAGQN